MTGASGSIGDDYEPLELQKHAPLQIDNIDMRVNVLKEYISKVPDATLKDLKKSLTGFSKATDNEFMDLVKKANPDKYKEISQKQISRPHSMPKEVVYLPKVDIISDEVIQSGTTYKKEELIFMQTHSDLLPKHIYTIYKIAFPQSQRNRQFIIDCRYRIKKHPDKYGIKNIPETMHQVKHITPVSTNNHILAQAITALYKSGKSPKLFSEIKPVIELIQDPNEINFAIECLTS